ncbi:MAG: hypothetical protein KF847_05625 [Pirellulales bacterium]|nr:hypothetical protein [Pirellulales bacterium]
MHRRIAYLAACALATAGSTRAAVAEGDFVAPVYQRQRVVSAYAAMPAGGGWDHPGHAPWPGVGWGFGFGPQMVFGGSWYQRPYPSHLDYDRVRRQSPASPLCPCEAAAPWLAPDVPASQ